MDSKGTLYFTSRGTYKGIVSWTQAEGARQYMDVATKAGPAGLWIDDHDNIFLTATGERQVQKISPDKKVTVVAEQFEAKPEIATGPNDVVVASNGTVYFTGPNGIALNADEKALYVSHNISPSVTKIVRWPLNADGSAGPVSELATINNCIADGIRIDHQGALWLACYSYGTAYRIGADGEILSQVTTEQKALTNLTSARGADNHSLYLGRLHLSSAASRAGRAVGLPQDGGRKAWPTVVQSIA